MKTSLGWVACALVLGTALLLSGCKKKPAAVEKEGAVAQKEKATAQRESAGPPPGNPVLPQPGQQLQAGGAVQNVRQAARRTVDSNQLRNFAMAYFQYQTSNGQGPARVEDIKESLDANTIAAFKEGSCVGVWNLRNLSSTTIVAYVKDPDSYGTRVVAMGDGSAQRLNQQQFEAAMKAK
jgi:hypothetical protein